MIEGRRFRRILLIRRKALGDALVTMPAVLKVASAWPTAAIDLVVDRPFASLLAGLAPGIRILTWPGPSAWSWIRDLRSRRYDLVIDWLGNPRTAMWTALTGASVRVGYDLPRRSWAYNIKVPRNRLAERPLRGFAGEAFLDPLRLLGLDPEPWGDGFASGSVREPATAGLGQTYRRWLPQWTAASGRRVVVMLSATWPAKAWPDHHGADLLLRLRERGLNPLLVTGPGDEDLETALRRRLPGDAFAPPTNLLELADLLREADLFVGTDCGARHLAASLGVPTVTLFGPTDPQGWNPASPRHVAVRTGVACSPCDLTECPVDGHPCLDELTPGMVLAAIEKMLGRMSDRKVIS